MTNRRGALLAAVMMGWLASEAAACATHSSSSLCCVPGLGLTGAYVGVLLPILSAFIERPFFTLAGVREGALFYSIGTNLISAILLAVVGLVGVGLVWGMEFFILVWIPGVILVSTFVEHFWINRHRGPIDGNIRFGWLLLGNVISAVLIMLLPAVRAMLGPVDYDFQRWIWRNTGTIALLTVTGSVIVYIYAFSRTGILPPKRGGGGRGFEVLPVPPRIAQAPAQ